MPPMSCTSKCRSPSVRREASRTTANASGSRSSTRLAGGQLVAELTGLVGEIGVGQGLQGRLERVDPADRTGVLTDEPLVAATKYTGEPIGHGGSGKGREGKGGDFTGK